MNLRNITKFGFALALCAPSVAQAQTYLVADTASPWEDIAMIPNVGTVQTLGLTTGGTDDGGATMPIGFTFSFLGTDFTAVTVSTNGLLTFGNSPTIAPSRATTFSNAAIPSSSTPNNIIAAWCSFGAQRGW